MVNLNFKTLLAATFLMSSPCVFGSGDLPAAGSQFAAIAQVEEEYDPDGCTDLRNALRAIQGIEKGKIEGSMEDAITALHTLLDSRKYYSMHLFMSHHIAHASNTGFVEISKHYANDADVLGYAFYNAVVLGKRDLAQSVQDIDINHLITSSSAALWMVAWNGKVEALDLILSKKQSPYAVATAMISAALDCSKLADPATFINAISVHGPDIEILKKEIIHHSTSGAPFIPEHKALIQANIDFDTFKSNPSEFCG